MTLETIALSVIVLGGVCLFFGAFIALANRNFKVWEDPRIDAVEQMLPLSNCGACGTPGCRAFAELLVDDKIKVAECTSLGAEDSDDIARYLGVDAGSAVKRVARLMCAGGKAEAMQHGDYQGFDSCKAASKVASAAKACTWGCIGLADCVRACTFDAITMNDNGLPLVDLDLCTACDDCVLSCPKDLFEIHPLDNKLLVQCKSLLKGAAADKLCSMACNGCGKCVHDAPKGAIDMHDTLAVIDYSFNSSLSSDATKRCPTDAIQWVEAEQFNNSKYDLRENL